MKWNFFAQGGPVTKLADKINGRRRWFDKLMVDLDYEASITTDADTFLATAKRLYRGENVSRCNMNTFLKVACQNYVDRVRPDSIESARKRNNAKAIIAVIEDMERG